MEEHSNTVFNVSDARGQQVTRNYHLSEVPVFVRGGAIMPTLPEYHPRSKPFVGREEAYDVGGAQRDYDVLVLTVYPGGNQGECQVNPKP